MGYVDANLMRGERVTFRTQLHWIIFTLPVLLLFFALMIGVGDHRVGTMFLLIALFVGSMRYLQRATSEFAVTNKRVIIKIGILRRKTLELQRSKVESVAVHQGIIARIFGYGTIVVGGTGGTKEPFRFVASALDLRRAVQADPETPEARPA